MLWKAVNTRKRMYLDIRTQTPILRTRAIRTISWEKFHFGHFFHPYFDWHRLVRSKQHPKVRKFIENCIQSYNNPLFSFRHTPAAK